MSEYQEFTGKSVEEAIKAACDAFGVGLGDLDFEILTPGSRGVLGMGAEPARIVAAPRSALGGTAPKREAAESKPLAPPPAREDRGPRPDYGDRPSGDRDRGPRREYGDRPSGDRPPRREYGDRPTGDRPSGDRPAGDRPAATARATDRPGASTATAPRATDRPGATTVAPAATTVAPAATSAPTGAAQS